MPTRRERIEGAIIGLLVGDALGVPYEFFPAHQLPPSPALEFEPPAGFHRSHPGVPPGTFSDDGAHALCLLASLLRRGKMDIDELGRRLVNWREHGYLAVDGEVFDVGIQTSTALSRLQSGVPAREAGPREERDNGNGSLMRVLPLALWHQGDDGALIRDARAQSLVTHGHLRSQLCCVVYCLWVRRTLEGLDGAWESAAATLRAAFPDSSQERPELDVCLGDTAFRQPGGTGYVVDTLHSARRACEASDYEQVVKAAIAFGNDTDTTAAVAGGLAGARAGIAGIPSRWRERLRGAELYQPLIDELLKTWGGP